MSTPDEAHDMTGRGSGAVVEFHDNHPGLPPCQSLSASDRTGGNAAELSASRLPIRPTR
jgi:hypothetical protein